MSIKTQLLDPLGSFCKLIALNFSELNTKISIHNHVLTLQRPDSLQCLVRLVNGDGKENVSELFYIIVRIIKWYLITDDNEDDTQKNCNEIARCEEILRLVKYICSALRKLQETYEYGNVILSIQFYINILEDAVNNQYCDNKLPKYIIEKETEYANLLDYDKLRNFWEYKKLKRICELYDSCFNVYNDIELANTEKDAHIEGSLKTINAILEITDNEFQKLIQNSNRG